MKKETKATALRQKAEAMLKTRTVAARSVSETDTLKLIHELEVHQIELELLNEELQLGKQQAELAAEKYTSLYDFAPTGYFSLSAGGKILELNLACSRMLGGERLHLQNKLFGFFVSNESKPAFNHFLAEAFSGTANVTCEIKLTANGGIPMVVSLTGVHDESGELCLVTAVDITERKLAEARLQKDTERNALLVELFVQAPALTDKELYDRALDIAVKLTDSKIGFFHQVSDNQQEIILTTWNDEARKNCTTITDNHYPIKAAGNWADCVRQKQAVVYNDFQQSPNQKGLPEGHAPVGRFMSIPVVQDDKVQLIFGVGNKTTDYTDSDVVQIQFVAGELYKILEKRKVEKSLHNIEDRWQFAIEGSNDGIWDWNVLTDEVYFSNRWKEMIGYGPDELEGKLSEWKERVHAEDLPEVMETLQRHFNGETSQYVTEHRIRCRDGSWKWITDRGKVLEWTPEGKPARMVGTHIDITGRKLVEDTQKFLLGCGLPGMGEDFFESLARYLAETLNMEYVCIDQLEGDRLTAQTVAIYNEGRFESNVQYTLRDTPCGEVAEKHVCCYPDGVQRKFPNDAALKELNAESYVGTTLIDSNGQAIGLIAIIGHHPLVEAGKAESLLKLVAPRAAGEMERLKIETERSQAESKLKESEEKFRIVADNAFNWEFWEGEDGQWIHHSPSCKKLTGYSADEFMNDNELLLKIIHPDDLQAYLIHHQEVKTYRAPASHYFRIITKEGETRDIEHVCQPVFNNTGSTIGIRGSNIDITERKQAEEKLRASESLLREIAANYPNSYVSIIEKDLTIGFTSGQEFKKQGLDPEQFVGLSLEQVFGDHTSIVHENYMKAFGGVETEFELFSNNQHQLYRAVPLTGKDGRIERVLAVVENITSRKQAEEKLRASEAMMAASQRIGHVGSWVLDLASNQLTWSDEVYRIFGIEPQSFGATYEAFLDRIHPDDRSAVDAAYTASLRERRDSYEIEHRIVRLDTGEVRHVHERSHHEYDAAGAVLRSVGMVQDITERKQAEEELRASEEKFRTLLTSLTAGVVVHAPDTTIRLANPAASRILGLSEDQMFGKVAADPHWKFLCEDGSDMPQDEYPVNVVLATHEPLHNLVVGVHRTISDIVWVLVDGFPVFKNSEEVERVIITFVDITERKRADEAIIRAAEEQRILLDNINTQIWYLTDETTYGTLNKAHAEFNGVKIEDLAFKNLYDIFPKDIADVCKLSNTEVFASKKTVCTEEWIPHVSGEKRLISITKAPKLDKNGNVEFVVCSAEDITYRKQAEDALRESEEKFREMANLLPQVVFETDNNNCFTYLNKTAFEIFGYPYDYPILGVNILDYFTPESRISAMHNILQKISGNQTGGTNEYVMVKHDGTTIPVLVFSSPIVKNGKNIGLRGIVVNISELKQMEQELVKAKEHAEESDRLKSAFLANMSHEIRTPMNGILGFAGLLKEPNLSGEEQQKFIGIIEKSGARMLNIINDIVDISKIEAGLMKLDIRETNINEQIEYIYTFFKPEVEAKGMKLSFKTPLSASEAIISTDREKLYAIFTNLVKNAIKYSGYGEIDMGYKIKGEFLEFFVKDTGIGIPKDRQQAIFERFIQADISDKMAKQGAGLGLSITKAYIEMLGGKIWVESEEGIGSTFYFTLPYNSGAAQVFVDQSLVNSLKGAEVRKLKILIAEDDETSEILLEEIVSNFSKELLIARTGIEAVEICKQNPDIDLVLMDIRMPEMSGYEAISHIREFNKEVIIIAQTAYGLSGDREKAIESGANDYISKPIVKDVLQSLTLKYFRK
jgi:PAS domain S-box-containing protein